MHREHRGAGDDGALRVLDDAADRAGRDALRVRAAGGPQQDTTDQKSERSNKVVRLMCSPWRAVMRGRHSC